MRKEPIQIVLWPSYCLCSKLRTMLRQIIKIRSEDAVLLREIETGSSDKKSWVTRTFSFVRKDISEQQAKQIPSFVSFGFCVYNVVYGLFFVSVLVTHTITFSVFKEGSCDATTWTRGCQNKIPFCKHLFNIRDS